MAFFAWGVGFYGHGVYLKALQDIHGWPTSLLSAAVTAFWLAGIPAVVMVGRLVDRYGPNVVVAYGGIAMGLSVAALGFLTAPWQLFAAFLLMSSGYASLTTPVISTILMPWFEHRLGLALSIALTGASVGGMVLVPLMVQFIQRYDFRATAVAAGFSLCVSILLLAGLVIRGRPGESSDPTIVAPHPASPGPGSVPRAGAQSAGPGIGGALSLVCFWTIAVPFSLGLAAQVGFLVHQIKFLEPVLGLTGASLAVSVTTLAAIGGRLALGAGADFFHLRALAAGCFLLGGSALALMAVSQSPIALYAGCVALGLVVGNTITLPALLVRATFGDASFGAIFGIVYAGMFLGNALGPSLVGVIRDRTGSYAPGLWVLVLIEALALAIVIWERVPLAFRRAPDG